ncbi:hypothetical protein HA72_2191 [Metallosphaera sedula]|uniref:Uncharacterized protein n=2 Tax=Metallosphaera sedula TaxID=43687 RepID=A4YIS8_METS5|nr:hypothetical protein [Metallosphaera sedula]ABP96330.1 hypothetical protein Msed_2191 [Metallosphaera sedula DSM 5348]AIM28313.1 hypothetical protein HA72_2191 [Metallosphaera sedula]AKV75114.1 hypothetical protein MsedA_2244 [Metallosphaera sedula]AKV77352.1 hypothetical protein MsedB_2246 [Metallosphaera sedula]AKV79603.1 hypothetical protein MsedC_2244 [Metallosphaera sedula]
MSVVDIIEKVAKRMGLQLNILPNGVVIVIKDGIAFVQISVVREVYYIRYLIKNEAYILRRLNEKTAELILDEKLDETNALKIPDV